MNRTMLKNYMRLVDFLGQTLGPDYEITLHEIVDKTCSIVAIANGQVSGRTLNDAPIKATMELIAGGAYKDSDYRINYNGISNGSGTEVLRSSTLYIKDAVGKLVGLLCVNFDDRRFQKLSTELFQLCHPDEFVDRNIVLREDLAVDADMDVDVDVDHYQGSVTEAANSLIQEVIAVDGMPADRLTQEEKIRIVGRLNRRGIFRVKGAVIEVAEALYSSPASIYRYLSKAQKKQAIREEADQT